MVYWELTQTSKTKNRPLYRFHPTSFLKFRDMHLTKHNIYAKDFKISSYDISKYTHFNLDGEVVA